MRILGISAHYHDAAAALLVDGAPVCAVQEERLSRRKNDASFPMAAIEWCLDHAGVDPGELDAVVFYEKPMLKFERILTMALRGFPRTWPAFPRAMKNSLGGKLWVRGIISSQLGVRAGRILFAEHHQSHAAAAFLTAPTRRAAILTADGVGEWATLSVGVGSIGEDGAVSLRLLRELHFPHSLGMLYSTFTAYLGFPVNEGEYKVMGCPTSTSTRAPGGVSPTGSSRSWDRRGIQWTRSIWRLRTGRATRTSPRAFSGCWRTSWSIWPAHSGERPGSRTSVWAAASR